ncbi:FG-GAP-like repeat-containing protein [Streptomyces sp. NPDC053431]|uniref:FG-GAP-like repeat-containing protein n=1 Tax=Streptomyces sp. NPDC053431 TaxID=3365703 RepID=UPI0037CE76C6
MAVTVVVAGSLVTPLGVPGWASVAVAAVGAGVSPLSGVGAPQSSHAVPVPEVLTVKGAGSGYLPGSSSVSPDGVLSYGVPLDVPAGRAGMEPRLSLEYSANGGNSVVGRGWSISGLSRITRCDKSLSADGVVDGVDFADFSVSSSGSTASSSVDDLCLDGKRLVAVSGAYGRDGAEYRTESDSFAKITSSGASDVAAGPDLFTVRSADGLVREYEPVTAPRVAANATGESVLQDRARTVWVLKREKDRSGNQINYVYEGSAPQRIKEIGYTYGPGGQTDIGFRKVRFVYQDRPDVRVSWVSGVKSTLDKRLAAVEMWAPSPGAVEKVWQYNLEYEPNPVSQGSRLVSVQRCGAKGGCLWKKKFRWTEKGLPEFDFAHVDDVGTIHWDGAAPPVMQVADVNGDGLDDVLFSTGAGQWGAPSLAVGSRGAAGVVQPLSQVYAGQTVLSGVDLTKVRMVDLEGDGRAEVWALKKNGQVCEQQAYRWNATSHQFEAVGSALQTTGGECEKEPANFADLNGDGLVDLIRGDSGHWTVRFNPGGGSVSPASWPGAGTNEPSGYARVVDLDADGRAELLSSKPFLGGGMMGTAIGTNDAGNVQGVDAGFPDVFPAPDAVKEYGDFNGDGLKDALRVVKQGSDVEGAWIRTNTGNGFGPAQAVTLPEDMYDSPDGEGKSNGVYVADLNGDGLDDLITYHRHPGISDADLAEMEDFCEVSHQAACETFDFDLPKATSITTFMLSKGDGTFTMMDVPLAGAFAPVAGWTSRHGDFNGDGRTDTIRFGVNDLNLRIQRERFSDRIDAVFDEKTDWPREQYTYSNSWSDKPGPSGACSYPTACVRRGLTVVRKVTSHAHLVDPDLTSPRPREITYSYEDPTRDVRGRGFLGFAKVKVFDKQRPAQTVTTYDNRTRVTNPSKPLLAYYPKAGLPQTVTTAIPLLTQQQVTDNQNTPAPVTARVTQEHDTHELVFGHNNSTHTIQATTWTSDEWEEQVNIDWDELNVAGVYEHIYNIAKPATVPRHRSGALDYDSYGNVLHGTTTTEGGVSETTDATYDNDPSTWLIGLKRTQAVTRSEADNSPAPVTRHRSYTYTTNGLLKSATVEENNTNASVPVTTTLDYTSRGVIKSVKTTAGAAGQAATTRETRYEYVPQWPGQPDEQVYASQVWSPFTPAQYQPSQWLWINPATGNQAAALDVNGVWNTGQFDDVGRLVTATAKGGEPVSLTYAGRPDAAGGMNGTITTATVGNRTGKTVADAMGRTITSTGTGFNGALTSTDASYDVLGRATVATRPHPAGQAATSSTTRTFDALDRLVKTVTPDNKTSRATYSGLFETHHFDASNHETFTVSDVNGRITQSTALKGTEEISTHFAYGPFDLLEKVTDDLGNITSRAYDVLGRLIQETDPDTGTVQAEYNGFGQRRKLTHTGSGESTTYSFDALGRVTGFTNPDGTTSFTYDTRPNGMGRLASATSPDQVTTVPSYDDAGRSTAVTQTVNNIPYTLSTAYDPVTGRPTQQNYPSIDNTTNPGLSLKYHYNPHDYLDKIGYTTPGQNEQPLWAVNARNLDLSLDNATLGNGTTTSRIYEASTGQLKRLKATTSGQTVFDLEYTFKDNGLVENKTDHVTGRRETYGYDDLNRLTSWELINPGTAAKTTGYAYDNIGNLTDVTLNTTPIEQNLYGGPGQTRPHTLREQRDLTTATPTATTYTYDARGRQCPTPATAGTCGGRTLNYTQFDLPKTVTKNGQATSYLYDAFGQRVKKTGPDGTTVYVGGVYEKHTATDGKTTHVFTAHAGDGPIGQITRTGTNGTPQTTYTLTDRLGSTEAVINPNGQITRTYYDPFGKPINADATPYTGPASPVTKGYTGHEMENNLGLINAHGRIYDPTQKHFLTPDPIIHNPLNSQHHNPYSYVANNPVNATDPTGYEISDFFCGAPGYPACESGGENGNNSGGTSTIDNGGTCDNANASCTPPDTTGDPTNDTGSDSEAAPQHTPEQLHASRTGTDEAMTTVTQAQKTTNRITNRFKPLEKQKRQYVREGNNGQTFYYIGITWDAKEQWCSGDDEDPQQCYTIPTGRALTGVLTVVLPALTPTPGAKPTTPAQSANELDAAASSGKAAKEAASHGEVVRRDAGHRYAAGVYPGGTGDAFAGHGHWEGGGMTLKPGTSITAPADGVTLSGEVGRAMERGKWDEIGKMLQEGRNLESITGMQTYVGNLGATMKNYTGLPPTGIRIMAESMTVEVPTRLSDMPIPASGNLCWAACTGSAF